MFNKLLKIVGYVVVAGIGYELGKLVYEEDDDESEDDEEEKPKRTKTNKK